MGKPLPELFLQAAPGRRVKDPMTLRLLAEGGEYKPDNSFWRRRLRDEDVIEVKPESKTADPEPRAKKAKE